jgi:starch-binding outer membrane protein, SusD/RagB family
MTFILAHRKNLLIFFLNIIFLFAGCRKMFHEEEISIGKITSYDQLISAVGGVYADLASPLYRDYSYSFYSPNLKGDDINIGVANYDYYIIKNPRERNCYDASNTYSNVGGFWREGYSTIVSANNIITQIKSASAKEISTREILGEMYLISAYGHFRLTRSFGQVPIIDNIDVNYNVPKPTYTDIYKFIEHDLRMAMELLPVNTSSARIPYETPNRGSAKAILAEVYLSWAGYPANDASKYASAAKEAGETIDSADYFGFKLLDDFTYLWDKKHLYNSESVFALYCSNSKLQYYSYYNWKVFYYGRKNSRLYPQYYPIARRTVLDLSFFPVEINFYNNYPAGYRKEITFYTTVYYDFSEYDSTGRNILHADTGYTHIDQVNKCSRIGYRKFYYEPYEMVIDDGNPYALTYFGQPRVYLFRFTQTVLTYAEAMARSGQLNTRAYECVNQIRRRAHHLNINMSSPFDLPAGLSPEVFADSVVWERAWELCGEPEGRWFDLVRLEKVEYLSKLRNPYEDGPPNGVYNKSVYFFPIPPLDTLLNPNLGK